MSTDTWLKIVCSMMINAVMFGIGLVFVLLLPATSQNLKLWIPIVVLVSFALAPFLTGFVARRMRLQNWGPAAWRRGDRLSG